MDIRPALPTNERKTSGAENMAKWQCPEFKVSGTYSSHMVLQRNRKITVKGFSQCENGKIRGNFAGEYAECTVHNGQWVLTFSPREASFTAQTMEISDDLGHREVFEDILIGDVYFIGGQSNAEMTLAPCNEFSGPEEFVPSESIRLYIQTREYPYLNQSCCEFPQPDVICPSWQWRKDDYTTALNFSAMGWFFGREAIKHISVPLGLVMMAAGGACVRELVSEDLAHSMGYTFGAAVKEGGFFNSLIYPFKDMKFRAMLFFQGESEGGCREFAERYDRELALLVEEERELFGFDFPFYNVQLSDYREECRSYFPWLDIVRIRQQNAEKLISKYHLVADMDLGSPEGHPDFAHSPLKKELGIRLAKAVLYYEYGVGNESEMTSPRPIKAVKEGDKVRIMFSQNNSPLMENDLVKGFSFGDYGSLTPAEAKTVSPYEIDVSIPKDCNSDRVNYAFSLRITPDNADLKGTNGIPCPAFSLLIE